MRLAFAALALVCACDEPAAPPATPAPSSSAAPAPAREVDESVVPAHHPCDPNPFGLPARAARLPEGQRVYAVPERMLCAAKLGGSLELVFAKVEGMDGREVSVRIGFEAAYSIHPGYLVIPQKRRVARGSQVLAPHGGRLRHAIVQRLVRDKVAVRFEDAGALTGDVLLPADEIGALGGGLEAGAYALQKTERGYLHVLLVSAAQQPEGKRWLALGADGEALLVAESDLSPMPEARLKPGAPALVAWRAQMVPATVRAVDPSGLVTVKRPFLGPALVVGPQMVMPAR